MPLQDVAKRPSIHELINHPWILACASGRPSTGLSLKQTRMVRSSSTVLLADEATMSQYGGGRGGILEDSGSARQGLSTPREMQRIVAPLAIDTSQQQPVQVAPPLAAGSSSASPRRPLAHCPTMSNLAAAGRSEGTVVRKAVGNHPMMPLSQVDFLQPNSARGRCRAAGAGAPALLLDSAESSPRTTPARPASMTASSRTGAAAASVQTSGLLSAFNAAADAVEGSWYCGGKEGMGMFEFKSASDSCNEKLVLPNGTV